MNQNFEKYRSLTLDELREIATEVEINFTMGNENIGNKQEFLNVLDEADPIELEQSYQRVIRKRTSKLPLNDSHQ